jgi:hypothetical protein
MAKRKGRILNESIEQAIGKVMPTNMGVKAHDPEAVYGTEKEATPDEALNQSIIDKVKKYYDRNSELLSKHKEKINTFHEKYNGIRKKRAMKSQANVFVNEVYSALETIVSDIFSMICFDDPFFIAEPQDSEQGADR